MQKGMFNEKERMPSRPSAVLIANPTSGNHLLQMAQFKNTITFLHEHGWQAELKLTQAAGDACRIAHEAVQQNIDMVIAAGGDGTINEVIQELAGSKTALGVLPLGTVNVWAREVGIPLDYAGARDILVNGQLRCIDLGKIKDRYFLLMAGLGLDAEVTYAVEQKPVKRLGVVGYLLVGTWLGLGYNSFRVYMDIDGRRVKANALQVVIGNTQLYAGAIKYTWEAQCDDGVLDVCIVRRQGILRRLLIAVDFLLRHKKREQWVRYEKCRKISIRTQRPVAIQVDGDPYEYTSSGFPPTIVTVAPGILKVLVPQKTPEGLFLNEPPGCMK